MKQVLASVGTQLQDRAIHVYYFVLRTSAALQQGNRGDAQAIGNNFLGSLPPRQIDKSPLHT